MVSHAFHSHGKICMSCRRIGCLLILVGSGCCNEDVPECVAHMKDRIVDIISNLLCNKLGESSLALIKGRPVVIVRSLISESCCDELGPCLGGDTRRATELESRSHLL